MRIDRKNDLNLRLLEVFGVVMRNLTTVAAAEELGISQPAVSNAVKALERQFGFTLFERTNRGLIPTDEARIIFDEVDPVLSMLRGIEDQVRAIRATRKGRLRIAATPPLGQSAIPTALRSFLSDRQDVRISYDVCGVDRVIREVTAGIKDLGLLLGVESHPGCDVTSLFEGQMECVLQASHPLAALARITPADLVAHEFIGIGVSKESKLGALIQAAFAESGISYDSGLEVRFCHTASALANAGLGVAIVDSFSARFLRSQDLVRRPFEPRIPVTAVAIVRAEHPPSRVASAFITEIKDILDDENIS